MTTSKTNSNKEAFVWIWLPGQSGPVVAGKLQVDNENLLFNYGKSYLERINDENPAIPIYEPEFAFKCRYFAPSRWVDHARMHPGCRP